jgi:hypothetical protein
MTGTSADLPKQPTHLPLRAVFWMLRIKFLAEIFTQIPQPNAAPVGILPVMSNTEAAGVGALSEGVAEAGSLGPTARRIARLDSMRASVRIDTLHETTQIERKSAVPVAAMHPDASDGRKPAGGDHLR